MDVPRDVVFVSYAHADRPWFDKVYVVLKPYVRDGAMQVWADRQIEVGDVWSNEIQEALDRARVALLLVSPAFEASDFIAEKELPAILAAADAGKTRIVVAQTRAARLTSRGFSRLPAYQWTVSRDRSLESFRGDARTRALNDIAEAVQTAWLAASGAAPAAMSAGASRTAAAVVVPVVGAEGWIYDAPPLAANLVERGADLATLEQYLFGTSPVVGVVGASRTLGIQGPGGIGKTVLIRSLIERPSVRRAFPDGIYWVTLGQSGEPAALQAALLVRVAVEGSALPAPESLTSALRSAFEQKRALVVLDDAWQAAHVQAFDVLPPTSRLLITTRDADLVGRAGASRYTLGPLSVDAALDLLALRSGQARDTLPPETLTIIQECGALPLALAVLGALVMNGVSWVDVLRKLREGRHLFAVHEDTGVFTSLRAGTAWLSADTQQRYAELAIFPEDVHIPAHLVARLWNATGGMNASASSELLQQLATRRLLERSEEAPTVVTLHDLQRDSRRCYSRMRAPHTLRSFRGSVACPARASSTRVIGRS